MNIIDLQIHSTASDGRHTTREIVEMAKEQGLKVISLTDHDTVDGVAEAIHAGDELEVRVIPGIEISVEERGLHILGYGVDYRNPELLAELEKSKQSRIDGAKQMVENLKGAGFTVEWEDVLREATGNVVARPHIARAILGRTENREKLWEINTSHDFIEKYLTDESPYYVHRPHIPAQDAVGLIHRIGGIAVWSHPAIHFRGDPDGLEQVLRELIGWGLNGLEIFSSAHIEDDVEFLEGLAAKYKLLRTAGSDFHEKGPHHRESGSGLHSAEAVGNYEAYGFSTEGIIEKLDEAIALRSTNQHEYTNS